MKIKKKKKRKLMRKTNKKYRLFMNLGSPFRYSSSQRVTCNGGISIFNLQTHSPSKMDSLLMGEGTPWEPLQYFSNTGCHKDVWMSYIQCQMVTDA